jgi:7-cyano-7-deazaguanine reductase
MYDCATPYLIESKSLKLYFNSFNNTQFKDIDKVRQTVEQDLSKRLKGDVHVRILSFWILTLIAPLKKCILKI